MENVKPHVRSVAKSKSAMAQVQAKFQQGWALHRAGKLAQAQERYQQVLLLQPKHFDALHFLGVIAAQTGNFSRAVDLIGEALELDPHCAEAYNNRGNALQNLQQCDAALESYDRAIALRPDYAEAYNNRGFALQDLKQFEAALQNYDRAIALMPDYAEAHNNRGNALRELKQFEAALRSYDKTIALQPDHAKAHWNMSLCQLQMGDFVRGWEQYEWRWKSEEAGGAVRGFSQPLWLGAESLQSKTILLHAEQGLGDTIQFCRYAALVARQAASVVLEVQPALGALLADVQGPDRVVALGDPLPDFDFHCPLLSLPLALGTRLDTIPVQVPYVAAPRNLIAKWEAALGPKEKPRIGIAWSGSPGYRNDRDRSISLRRILPLLTAQVSVVSLHHEVCPEDRDLLDAHRDILHFGAELTDFADMAALMTQMDLVISVDTSVAHLAGALGRPVWVLLPFAPHWVWMLDRADSPWYPTARLFRQPRLGDWDSVIRTVVECLAELGAPL